MARSFISPPPDANSVFRCNDADELIREPPAALEESVDDGQKEGKSCTCSSASDALASDAPTPPPPPLHFH